MSDNQDILFLKELNVGGTILDAGRTGRPAFFQAITNVKLGDYFNAAKSYMDFGTAGTGEVAGMASSFNAEIRLPNKTVTSGAYHALEVNYNFQASTVLQSAGAPQAIATFKVGGDQGQIDIWEDQANAGVFSFQGLTSANGSVFETEAPGTIDACLAIMVGNTKYWINLSSAHD